jgi:hypothetical protein
MALFIDSRGHPPLQHYLFDYSAFRPVSGCGDNNCNIQINHSAMPFETPNAVLIVPYLPDRISEHDWHLMTDTFPLPMCQQTDA